MLFRPEELRYLSFFIIINMRLIIVINTPRCSWLAIITVVTRDQYRYRASANMHNMKAIPIDQAARSATWAGKSSAS